MHSKNASILWLSFGVNKKVILLRLTLVGQVKSVNKKMKK